MRIVRLFLCVTLMLSGHFLWSQSYKLSQDPATFSKDVVNMMNEGNNLRITQLGTEFDALWVNGKFNSQQQQAIINISQKMLEKHFKIKPHFDNFFSFLVTAANSPKVKDVDKLLATTEKVIDKYNNQEILNFLNAAKSFITEEALYHSSYNKLYVNGGSYHFEFIESEIPVEPEEVPEAEQAVADTEENGRFSDWDEESEDTNWDTEWEDEVSDESQVTEALAGEAVEQPPVSGAVIQLEGVSLVMVTPYDSVSIHETSGSFMLTKKLFVGSGGRFDWSIAGLDPQKVYCELDQYNFPVDKPTLTAENTKMHYADKVAEPPLGVFEFKSTKHTGPEDIKYPRFKSYQNNIDVKNLGGKNVKYQGGFALSGNKIFSSSLNGGTATIDMETATAARLKIISNRFKLEDSLIVADMAAVIIYHGSDSIFHPAVRLRYDKQDNLITLLKNEGGFKNLAYFSSYFDTDFTADMVKWDLDTDSLDITMLNARNKIPSRFESIEYYKDSNFDRLVALYGFNPLLMAVGYARKKNTGKFFADDMANSLKQNPEKIRGAMMGLMQEGFINYNTETGYVELKRKGYHYVLSKQNRKDYDNIMIPSISGSKPNGTINFTKNEITIRGIQKFYVSELLDVYIEPKENEIRLQENRDFLFDGFINAGNFQFIGRDFRFDYDSFLIALPNIDSIQFRMDTEGNTDKDVKLGITNQLVETAGVLYINKPNNKSASKIYPQYPIFKADVGAVVYFDAPEILDGVYDKSIYFTIPAFELDSASSSDPSVIKFKGKFTSGGIFPDFEEELTIMPDNSLGFAHALPYVGFKTYNGTGTVYNQITMDKGGLRSSGKVDFLTSTLYSDDFTYYIDSVTTLGESIEIKPGILQGNAFPQASTKNYDMVWFPKADSMYITTKEDPFYFYDESAVLNGTALITNTGIFGNGKLETKGSESLSETFHFSKDFFAAEEASFKIQSSNPEKPALAANGVKLNFNLLDNTADISAVREGEAVLDFPYTQFTTSISEAKWSLDDKTVSMTKPESTALDNSYFYTTREEMDSLVFNASAALYNIDKLELEISGIPYIRVADALIVPDSNSVLVKENADIQRFTQAGILLDSLNQYHNLYNGNIKITSRNEFEGDAIYQYVNAVNENFEIKFQDFVLAQDKKLKKENQIFTVSTGEIKEADNIYILPSTLYKGDVTLYANKKILQMDGFIKLDLKNIPENNSWIKHSSDNETQELVINVGEAVTETGQPLTSGLIFDDDTGDLYGTFISEKKTPRDTEFFNARGLFSYDSTSSEYKIIDPAKVGGKSYAGNIFAYNDINTDLRFEGKLNFLDGGANIDLKAAGKGKGNLKEKTFVLNSFQAIRFDLPLKAMELMGENMSDIVKKVSAPPAQDDQTALLYKLADAINEKTARDYQQRSVNEYISLASVSGDLAKSLVLSNVNMKWSDTHKAWYNAGKIGISNLLEEEVNAKLEGFLEYKKADGIDVFNLFIKGSPSTWYYFGYEDNKLQVFSSNTPFMSEIRSKSKVGKTGIGEYVFLAGDMEGMLDFIDRFRKDYLDIDEPYKIDTFAQEEILDEDFDTFEEDTALDEEEEDEDDGF